jgi:hypothetical protein
MNWKGSLLGEILVGCGHVSIDHIIRARHRQIAQPSKRIGECLLEMGFIRPEHLHTAIILQRGGGAAVSRETAAG